MESMNLRGNINPLNCLPRLGEVMISAPTYNASAEGTQIEKRRHKRFEAQDIVIDWNPLFLCEASILDISLDGISVNSEKGMKPGKECMVTKRMIRLSL